MAIENARAFREAQEANRIKDFDCQATGGLEESEENVLGSHESVTQAVSFCLGLAEDHPCSVGEPLERGGIGSKPLVGRLLTDAEGIADL